MNEAIGGFNFTLHHVKQKASNILIIWPRRSSMQFRLEYNDFCKESRINGVIVACQVNNMTFQFDLYTFMSIVCQTYCAFSHTR